MFTMKAWNKETNPTFRPCFIEVSVDRSVYTGCFDSLDFSQFLYSSFLTEINVRESPSVRKREPYSCNKNVKLLRCANISQGFKKQGHATAHVFGKYTIEDMAWRQENVNFVFEW